MRILIHYYQLKNKKNKLKEKFNNGKKIFSEDVEESQQFKINNLLVKNMNSIPN